MSFCYIDSSVILSRIFNETEPLDVWDSWKLAISSVILEIECLRMMERCLYQHRINEEEYFFHKQALSDFLRRMDLIQVNETLIRKAAIMFPRPLKTLDSIHLASALIWQETQMKNVLFLTHDQKLGKTAFAMGLQVEGI